MKPLLSQYDFLLTPTLGLLPMAIEAVPPFLSEPYGRYIQFVLPVSFAHTPAISVPAGLHDGLPVGVQLVARSGAGMASCSHWPSSSRQCPGLVFNDHQVLSERFEGGSRVKAQRVELFVCPTATPADTAGLQKLADSGKIKPDTLVALVGKTEGTGFHDDWGRVWADVALREWTGKFLGVPADEVAKHVIFVLSGGCPGVITPHIVAITREWVEGPDAEVQAGHDKRLVVGRAGSEPMPPEEVGRMGQIRKVAEATHKAMADAGLTDPKDVHLVMVKVPGLTTASITDAESRGKTVISHDLTFGPEGAGAYANDAAALGVAMALGEVPESSLSDDVVRRNWDLYSEVAMTSSGGEKRHGEVVVFGNSATSRSDVRIGHAVTRDFIDAEGVRDALRSAGLHFDGGSRSEAELVDAWCMSSRSR